MTFGRQILGHFQKYKKLGPRIQVINQQNRQDPKIFSVKKIHFEKFCVFEKHPEKNELK